MAEDVFKIVGTTQGGSFHVERVVAEGGFSIVYRALHGAFRAPVALKCLKVPDDLTPDQRADYLERFREEAELLFRLSARIPEVVRPLHVDKLATSDGRFVPFLALEWLDGEALSEVITRRTSSGSAPIGLVKLVKLLSPVAQALSRAHRFPGPAGRVAIVHCDLKPENIFITRIEGREVARILDYGIAMAMRSAGRKITSPAKHGKFAEPAFFTPGYAAPEQWSPKRFGPTGSRTDVWGLALTLVEAITSKSPLGEVSEERMKATALDEKKRPTPRAFGATVSDGVEAAFAKALAVQPEARTPDVPTFWSELEQALGLPPTFVRRDERQDPDEDRPSWSSSPPKALELGGAVSREGPSSPLVERPGPNSPPAARPPPGAPFERIDRPAAAASTLALEEPFTFDSDPAPAMSRRDLPPPALSPLESTLASPHDLEADLPVASRPGGALSSPSPPRAVEVSPSPEAARAQHVEPKAEIKVASKPAPVRPAPDLSAGFELASARPAEAARAPLAAPAPYVRAPVTDDSAREQASLRLPAQLMGGGAALAVVAVVGAILLEPIREYAWAPKFTGVGLFAAGLLLLFWRLIDR